MARKAQRRYWYLTTIDYCPACGRERKYRERVYAKHPQSVVVENVYDWCDGI